MIADMLIYEKLNSSSFGPSRYSEESAGFDLSSPLDLVVEAGSTELVPIGLRITLLRGTYGRIASRSCLVLMGIEVVGHVIDPDYEGEISVILKNHGTQDFNISRGDRIAQLICECCVILEVSRADDEYTSSDSELDEAPVTAGRGGWDPAV